MFEIIGLLIGTLILFAFATILGITLAGTTWLLLRKRSAPRKHLILAAAGIPIVSAAYMWLCVALLPSESLFGDIAQPLPNGYRLEALGKMPDFASISNPKSPYSYNGLSEYIGRLAVYGPLIVGQYSHPFGSFSAGPNEPFFIFDTRSGQNIDLPTLVDLQTRLGHPVRLTEVQSFRSQEPAYRVQQNVNRLMMFGPPIVLVQILIAYVLRIRHRTSPTKSNIYT